jgi:hypothetical protein
LLVRIAATPCGCTTALVIDSRVERMMAVPVRNVPEKSGPAQCVTTWPAHCRQQSRWRAHAMQRSAYNSKLYRQVNDALALAVLVAFSVLILLVTP